MNTRPRKIAIITSTRADWGLLSPIAAELRRRDDVDLRIIATNMHLDPLYGATASEIEADGFTIDERVAMPAASGADDSPRSRCVGAAQCMAGMAEAFERLRPDMAVILGDRYEMLAAATAAAIMAIPIAHIAGGEISEGAIDDAMRHAITKLSALHLTATEPYRRRVIQMGEDPARVINTGAIGVYNIANTQLMTREELVESVGMTIDRDTLLVTYHPATLDQSIRPVEVFDNLLEALDRFPGCRVLATYPNNDADGRAIIERLNAWGARNQGRVKVIPSLGKRRYLSALKLVGAVVGNSSSGIVEVPSAGIPTVDIGPRQRSRIAAESVIHCGNSADEIADAIGLALSPEWRTRAAACRNPYEGADTLGSIVRAIAETPLETLRTKKFHDLTTSTPDPCRN